MKQAIDRSIRLAGSTIEPPCHACAFFHSDTESYEVLLPFIKEGLDQGDKSFHIIDERRREEYMNRLRANGIESSAEKTGQLEVRGWENAHLRPGWFDQHAMIALVEEVLSDAKEKGYAHTRWIADISWSSDLTLSAAIPTQIRFRSGLVPNSRVTGHAPLPRSTIKLPILSCFSSLSKTGFSRYWFNFGPYG